MAAFQLRPRLRQFPPAAQWRRGRHLQCQYRHRLQEKSKNYKKAKDAEKKMCALCNIMCWWVVWVSEEVLMTLSICVPWFPPHCRSSCSHGHISPLVVGGDLSHSRPQSTHWLLCGSILLLCSLVHSHWSSSYITSLSLVQLLHYLALICREHPY